MEKGAFIKALFANYKKLDIAQTSKNRGSVW